MSICRKFFIPLQKQIKSLKDLTGTPENRQKLKSFIKNTFTGFLFGVLLTYILFLFLILQLNVAIVVATWISCLCGAILTIGLAFSQNVRCMILLILPQFFSRNGRAAIIGYAFIITLTGPGANITRNTEVLSESMSCGQEQLSTAMKELVDIMKRPFVAIKDAVKHVLHVLKKTLEKVKIVLMQIKDLIVKILNGIKKAFNWLGNIVNFCNKKIGTPFERCWNVLEEAVQDCKVKMGAMDFMCNITHVVKALCYSVKFLDVICYILDFINDAIIGEVTKKLDKFIEEIHKMFYVKIHFDHNFYFKTHSSKNMSQISSDITDEVKERSKSVFLFFNLFELLSIIVMFTVILKAFYYKYKYLTNDRFDNVFITTELIAIDEERKRKQLETLLPLARYERRKYIPIKSWALVWSEKWRITRSAFYLFITTIQLTAIIVTDYSLFWILALIRRFGKMEQGIEMPAMVTLDVHGDGMLADMYRGMFQAFDPMTEEYNVDPIPCLPNPSPPNYDRYFEIAGLTLFSWALLIFEPYGLRLRQIVMGAYYPVRARERAIWLYNNILRKRSSFLKIVRRQLRRKFVKDNEGTEKLETFGCLDYLRAKFNHIKVIRFVLGKGEKENFCMVCGSNVKDEMIGCMRPGCPGKYCAECFKELDNKCTICLEPMDYGDFSDISEEKDSSDEEVKKKTMTEYRPKYKRKRVNIRKSFTSEQDVEKGDEDFEYVFEILHESDDDGCQELK